jgi:hypothetical protein
MSAVPPGDTDPVVDDVTQPVTDYGSEPMIESVSVTPAPVGITPEIIAKLDEAATAFLGTRVRILSVKILSEAAQDSTSWADKGRVVVHDSHNVVQRRR